MTAPKIYAEIISTGSELMLGRMVDTNSAWLSETLAAVGVRTARHSSVGDDLSRLVAAFRRAWAEHEVVMVTGGLGPTEDDLTRPAAAEAFGRKLEYHESLAEELRDGFLRRGFTMSGNNLRQAWLPEGSILVPNALGTAPGFAQADQGRLMVFLPGVPQEMKRMVRDWVLPRLAEQFPGAGGRLKTVLLKTAGLGESLVDDRIGDLMAPDRNPAVGLLAAPDMVRVVVTAEADSEEELERLLDPTLGELEKRLDGHIFGRGETTLPEAVAALLKELNLSLTILDALTKGRLSGSLAPSLNRENWGGSQDLPWQPTLSGVNEILRLYAPDSAALMGGGPAPARRHLREIRLITTARPDQQAPPPREGECALMVESAVQGEGFNGGLPVVKKFNLGGSTGRALSRAAALSIFHLWQVLKTQIRL
ncbi:MAG: CinA family nicotinamide mononucleotide deamidase-related protein [Candidatus Adiutrix sp.]|jgi:nicotinamide-nucleotide amidase|nr:CinA family nicotinamide mononucleotide deamidase-related protein [Candidatus Adiutrix sp.]